MVVWSATVLELPTEEWLILAEKHARDSHIYLFVNKYEIGFISIFNGLVDTELLFLGNYIKGANYRTKNQSNCVGLNAVIVYNSDPTSRIFNYTRLLLISIAACTLRQNFYQAYFLPKC